MRSWSRTRSPWCSPRCAGGVATMPDERQGRRPDHRVRRLGRGGGVEPGRHPHAHPLPGAGRLGANRPSSRANGRDWEARRFGDFDISPNRRGRETDYPVNDDNSPMKVANFNGVGGGTMIYTAHWPRLHPSDFRVKSLDGVADDWPVDYWTLERFYAENDRMMGVSGLAGDPGVPPQPSADAADPARQDRHALRPGDEQARLALVAVRHHDRHHRLRRPREVHQSRPLHAGLRAGRQGQHRHHLLAARHPRRRRTAHALPGARDHDRRRTAWRRARSTTTRTARSTSSRPSW